MKKALFISLFVLVTIFVKGQSKPLIPSCSMDDYVLLENHPPQINDFEAAAVIQGEREKITLVADGYYGSRSEKKGFLSISYLDHFKKKEFVFLDKSSVNGKRHWLQSKAYFFYFSTGLNWYFWGFCIGLFIIAFLFLLPIVNLYSYGKWADQTEYKWSENWHTRKKILKIECITLSIFGAIGYGLYMAVINSNVVPGKPIAFDLLEPAVMIVGTIISGLFYLLILTVIYETARLIKKHNHLQPC